MKKLIKNDARKVFCEIETHSDCTIFQSAHIYEYDFDGNLVYQMEACEYHNDLSVPGFERWFDPITGSIVKRREFDSLDVEGDFYSKEDSFERLYLNGNLAFVRDNTHGYSLGYSNGFHIYTGSLYGYVTPEWIFGEPINYDSIIYSLCNK